MRADRASQRQREIGSRKKNLEGAVSIRRAHAAIGRGHLRYRAWWEGVSYVPPYSSCHRQPGRANATSTSTIAKGPRRSLFAQGGLLAALLFDIQYSYVDCSCALLAKAHLQDKYKYKYLSKPLCSGGPRTIDQDPVPHLPRPNLNLPSVFNCCVQQSQFQSQSQSPIPISNFTSSLATTTTPSLLQTTAASMAGLFRRFYDWLLRLFWLVHPALAA
jgi:hypothetical protein